ncbi:MAG: hypothetical protein AB1473_14535 [Thermodesulfobacteriota bacterium]
MADDLDERLRRMVNSSGFPLQIAIKHLVETSSGNQKWTVMTEEHPWTNQISGESGFIDLILLHEWRTQVLVIECKRVRDSQWIFLVPSSNPTEFTYAKSWTTYSPKWLGWLDWHLGPASFGSSFCVVPGQDGKAKPMLERTASSLVEATEAFAMEEYYLGVPGEGHLRTYFSVIVTTADLKTCRFDPNQIDVASGEIAKCEFEDVSLIRFRKSLIARNEETSSKDIAEILREKERTVFVVNSACFLDFLQRWELGREPSVLR